MLNVIMNRRTERNYLDKKVEKEKIDKILQAALTYPSGRNLKPIEVVVVENRETLNKLADARGKASQWLKTAAVGFVIIADDSESTTWIADGAIMATIIQLMGESLGLKSCWNHAENRFADKDESSVEDNIRRILDIPGYKRVLCTISMGYVENQKPGYKKEDLDYSKVHYEKY